MAATGRRYVETESPGYVVRPKTPIEPADTKKPGVIREKFRSVDPRNTDFPLRGNGVGKGFKRGASHFTGCAAHTVKMHARAS